MRLSISSRWDWKDIPASLRHGHRIWPFYCHKIPGAVLELLSLRSKSLYTNINTDNIIRLDPSGGPRLVSSQLWQEISRGNHIPSLVICPRMSNHSTLRFDVLMRNTVAGTMISRKIPFMTSMKEQNEILYYRVCQNLPFRDHTRN